jgi:phosphoserine phosphatase
MRTVFQECLDNLLVAEDELHFLDPERLTPDELVARNESLRSISDCVNRLIERRLATLTEEQATNLESLRTATAQLTEDLRRMQSMTQTINIVSSALDTIVTLVRLV